MFDPIRHKDCPATWAYYYQQQELALAGHIDIFDIALPVVSTGESFVIRNGKPRCIVREAIRVLGVPPPSEDDISFLVTSFAVECLIPVAASNRPGATRPTITIPEDDIYLYPFSYTAEDIEHIFDILRCWRWQVDKFASTTPCNPLGWIGGIYLPHPAGEDEMVMLWPWLHRPYRAKPARNIFPT